MTKTEFLQQLYNNLSSLTNEERNEIIQDFEEHFSAGIESGKTEEQICIELGSPESCAASYHQNSAQGEESSSARASASSPSGNSDSSGVYGTAYKPTPTPNGTAGINQSRNEFLWKLMFFFFVLCAFGVYPAAIGIMLVPFIIAIASIFAVALVPSGIMICFLISLSVMLFSMGLLMFFLMTWLLKFSFKKTGF